MDEKTLHMDVLGERYMEAPVIGLFETGSRQVYEFGNCRIGDQPKKVISLGRGRYCDVRFFERSVSQFHCEFLQIDQPGNYMLRDTGSTNGTYVNDIRVKKIRLTPGMWIFAGRIEMFVLGEDRSIPLRGSTTTSFWRRAAGVWGSNRSAGTNVRTSHMTIHRARHSPRKKRKPWQPTNLDE